MGNSLLIFNKEEYIELAAASNIKLDTSFGLGSNGRLKVRADDKKCFVNNVEIKPFQKKRIEELEAMVFEETDTQVFRAKEVIKIGGRSSNDIVIKYTDVSLIIRNDKLYVLEGKIYLNGKKISETICQLEIGDCLLVDTVKITYNGKCIECTGEGYSSSLHLTYGIGNDLAEFPVYKRSPRIIKHEPSGDIEIKSPPAKAEKKKGSLIKVIMPPLVMLCITIAISVLMKRGLFVIISAASMGMSVIFSITTFFGDRSDLKESEKNRVENYDSYLLKKRKELFELYNRQKESMTFHYPSCKSIEKMVSVYSSRIYERAANDADFLCLSVGNSNINSSYYIKYTKDVMEAKTDKLQSEMARMVHNFIEIPDMPTVIDLKKAHLGLVGEKPHIHRMLNSIIMQLCFEHSYHDIVIITLVEEGDREDFDWIKWYPHCKIRRINVSGLVSQENQRDQVLGNIAQVLKVRKQEKDKKESIYLPHFIFIIDNPKLIINHSIMEYLQGRDINLGYSLIYTTNMESNLPENIQTIYILNGRETGTLKMNESVLINKNVRTTHAVGVDLEKTARTLNPLLHSKGVSSQIPKSITFFEMFGVKKLNELPIKKFWNKNACQKSLAVPLGMRAKDDLVYLNLHEKAHGPHGLVAGTTGSGKSEILQSYILSLAVNFNPHDVGFLLIDYKGGGMANLFEKLPHLLGTITNLDGSESMRALASIKSELSRRQMIFNENGVNNINQYTKLFKKGEAKEPLPHLFLISDEFAELKKEQPEFMSELVSAARIGRSLGVHLILATQKPSGVVDDQIWSNSKFKLALKVQNESDSNEVIKTPDAARITLPGRAYLQVGNNEIYELFQSAWSGADYSEDSVEKGFDGRIYAINRLGQKELLNEDLSQVDASSESKMTQLDAVVEYIDEIYKTTDLCEVRKPWLPSLEHKIVTPHIDANANINEMMSYDLQISIGMVDIPEEQSQVEYCHDFLTDGNIAIFGASGFGKSTTQMQIALSLACKNSAEILNYYVIDLGNSSLVPLKGLPHTADYLSFDDDEKRKKLIKLLLREMSKRKKLFASKNAINFKMYNQIAEKKLKAIVVYIDNFDVVREIGTEFEEFISKLTRDGVGIGIYTVITASRPSAVRYSIINNFKNKIAQFMFDKSDMTTVVGRSNYSLTEIKGRAMVKLKDVSVMQCYLPAEYESDIKYMKNITTIVNALNKNYTGERVQGIRMLPDVVKYEDLVKNAAADDRKMVIGYDTEDVVHQYIDLNNPINLVVGMPQTGKTNILKLINKQCRAEKMFIVDSKGYDLHEMEDSDNCTYMVKDTHLENFIEELKNEVESRKDKFNNRQSGVRLKEFCQTLPVSLVLIDDADHFIELTKSKVADMEKIISGAVEYGISFVISMTPTMLRGYDNLSKMLKNSQSGVALGNPSGQNVFQIMPPRGYNWQVEKGFLFNRGKSKIIKIPKI